MRIAIDTGGTFTDCVFVRDGRLEIVKVPSQRAMPEEAIASAVRAVRKPLKPMNVFSDEQGVRAGVRHDGRDERFVGAARRACGASDDGRV